MTNAILIGLGIGYCTQFSFTTKDGQVNLTCFVKCESYIAHNNIHYIYIRRKYANALHIQFFGVNLLKLNWKGIFMLF